MRCPIPLIAALVLAGFAPSPSSAPLSLARWDLDVGIPAGSPTTWGRRFPAIQAGPGVGLGPGRRDGGQTSGASSTAARGTTSFGLVRILTWDLMAHLPWIVGKPAPPQPITGQAGKEAAVPPAGGGVYWVTMASFLRLLLHPQLVSEKETVAHLIEIGEPVMGVLDAVEQEAALRAVVAQVRAAVGSGSRAYGPLPGATPRESMLSRWVAEELVGSFPYDPEAGFGRRLFLFAEEIEPLLIRYLDHEDSLLRRNAAAALSRYATKTAAAALQRAAATSDDPVVLMRALARLGETGLHGDPEPLLQRLRDAERSYEVVARIECAGRAGMVSAIPLLLEKGKQAIGEDPDLLQAALAALCRLPPGGHGEAVRAFARRVETAVATTPKSFQVVRATETTSADDPDRRQDRGTTIGQLAQILRARLGGSSAQRRLLAQLDTPKPSTRGRINNGGMGKVHPAAMVLFVESLPLCGSAGQKALQALAVDPKLEITLRNTALRALEGERRGATAMDVLGADDVAARAMATDVLVELGRGDNAHAVAVLKSAAAWPPKDAEAAVRHLWRTTLLQLERADALPEDLLIRLLDHVRAVSFPVGDGALRERRLVEELVNGLVILAAVDLKHVTVRRVDELLDAVIDHNLNPRVKEAHRSFHADAVRGHLQGLKGHAGDQRYQALVVDAICEYLVGPRPTLDVDDPSSFQPVVLWEPEILLALGRMGSPAAVGALEGFLVDDAESPFRAHAVLAAGLAGDRRMARKIVPFLHDPDGFVRFSAYEALRHLSGEDYWVDWMYGDGTARGAAAQRYFVWCLRQAK